MPADLVAAGRGVRRSAGRRPYPDVVVRTSEASRPKRIRRRPEVAEREILDAAEGLLQDRDFRDLTVEEVMNRTRISRSTFYNYFADRNALVLGLLRRVEGEMMEAARPWLGPADDPVATMESGLDGIVDAYARHGRVLRAIHEASYHDREVERYYRAFIQNFIDAVAAGLRREVRIGRADIPDPKATAHALLMMNVGVLVERLGGPDADSAKAVAKTLKSMWKRVVYGGAPPV